MFGLLRVGYYDLLIDIYFSFYVIVRFMMNSEFIVFMIEEIKSIIFFFDENKKYGFFGIGFSIFFRLRM